jgi:hypothetical protein
MANRRRAAARRPGGEGSSGRALVGERAAVVLMCGVLALAVWLVFGQTLHHGFVNFDDNEYVYDNHGGRSAASRCSGIAWAFTHTHASNWQSAHVALAHGGLPALRAPSAGITSPASCCTRPT